MDRKTRRKIARNFNKSFEVDLLNKLSEVQQENTKLKQRIKELERDGV